MHGGSSPQAVAAARRRLAAASDLAAEALLEIAMDRKAPRGERLKALDSILDRGGAARRSELGIDADTVRSSLGERLDALDADAAESPADPQSPTVPAVGELGPGVTVDAVEDDAGRPDDAAGHSDGPDPG